MVESGVHLTFTPRLGDASVVAKDARGVPDNVRYAPEAVSGALPECGRFAPTSTRTRKVRLRVPCRLRLGFWALERGGAASTLFSRAGEIPPVS